MTRFNTYSICLIALTLLIGFQSCKSDKQANNSIDNSIEDDSSGIISDYYNKIMLANSEAVFRNVNFDELIADVKTKESEGNLVLADEADGYLQYEKDIFVDTANGVDYMTLKYVFDSYDRLWIISVNYIIQDSVKTNQLFDHFHEKFSERYGDYYRDREGFDFWEGAYNRNDSTEVMYDIGLRKFIKFNDPGLQIEYMRFGKI